MAGHRSGRWQKGTALVPLALVSAAWTASLVSAPTVSTVAAGTEQPTLPDGTSVPAEASRTDTAAYAAFFHAMLDAGVYLPPSAYEAWFVSAAHDDRAVSTVLDALPAAALAAATAGGH